MAPSNINGSESSENVFGVEESDYLPALVREQNAHIDQLITTLAQGQQLRRTMQEAAERAAKRLRDKEMQMEEAEERAARRLRERVGQLMKKRSENAELRERAESLEKENEWLKQRVRLLERQLQATKSGEEVAESAHVPRLKRRFIERILN